MAGAPGRGQGENGDNYPNYENDEEIFASFVREHTILVTPATSGNAARDANDDSDNDDDDANALLEPSRGGKGTAPACREACYLPLLQRIRNRHYYDESPGGFVVEVPLQELVQWDAVRGADLAERVQKNTMRYHDLFCGVFDAVLRSLPPAGTAAGDNHTRVRDSMDVLQEQREAQQEARRAAQEAAAQAGAENGLAGGGGGGGIAQDAAVLAGANNRAHQGATEDLPPLLTRRYELRILPLGRRGTLPPFSRQAAFVGKAPAGLSLRHIRSRSVGRLVTVQGMIVRSSDVKPFCAVATYTCDVCGCEIYQVVQTRREFLPQRLCPSDACRERPQAAGSDTLHLQTRGSKFVKFQELRLQELPSQVPIGHVPRSMAVHCRGELTRMASPGHVVTIDGVFLPRRIAESGFAALKAGLVSLTYMEAQHIVVHKKSYDDAPASGASLGHLSPDQRFQLDTDVTAIATGPDPVGALSSAIAPEIFGHEDIKRALLLQLVGGCTRKLPDGMRIRGDINICLMGDPGVAKSQLLKHVASVAPRGVYTTGKGSSGVGLTAAVTKDVVTGEMALEGGALVLADRGICAIDEFDKMEEADRTAIHEVMEQQTVSVAKAGIVATLNARAAVLAAANPLYGRYNKRRSLSENVNLPNSLLSRFDLLFLILDVPDVERDMALARHVTFVHQNEGLDQTTNENNASPSKDAKNRGQKGHPAPISPDNDEVEEEDEDEDDDDDDDDDGHKDDDSQKENASTKKSRKRKRRKRQKEREDDDDDDASSTTAASPPRVTPPLLREYIARARRYYPVVPSEVAPYICEAYVGLRLQQQPHGDQTVMTARQLLSILRLGQALARLRFSDYVARQDVDEAIRLTHMSKASLALEEEAAGRKAHKKKKQEDVTSRIFHILRDYATSAGTSQVELQLCQAMVLRKGFTAQQLQYCLEEYQALDVLQLNQSKTHLYFL